jgi:hypothetical protein
MADTLLFCFVFATQVLWISLLFPMRAWRRGQYVLQNCPPSTHPKLYAKPVEWHVRVLRIYLALNLVLAAAGFGIVVALIAATLDGDWDGAIVTFWSASGEWDAAIVMPFFFLQLIPHLYVQLATGKHFKAMGKAPPPPVRTTELRRRGLLDLASPALLTAAAATYVAFIAFALYFRRFEFAWYTATGNIVAITAANVGFALGIFAVVYGRRADFFQAEQRRFDSLKVVVRWLLISSIAVALLVATNLILKVALGPDFLEPVIASLFCQGAALIGLWPSLWGRVDNIDFDVYRQDALRS